MLGIRLPTLFPNIVTVSRAATAQWLTLSWITNHHLILTARHAQGQSEPRQVGDNEDARAAVQSVIGSGGGRLAGTLMFTTNRTLGYSNWKCAYSRDGMNESIIPQ